MPFFLLHVCQENLAEELSKELQQWAALLENIRWGVLWPIRTRGRHPSECLFYWILVAALNTDGSEYQSHLVTVPLDPRRR